MRARLIILGCLLLVHGTTSQLEDLPQCAATCILRAVQEDGCAEITDFQCHCSKDELVVQISSCVTDSCPKNDQSAIINGLTNLCSNAGIDVDDSESTPSPTSSSLPTQTTTTTSTTSIPSPTSNDTGNVQETDTGTGGSESTIKFHSWTWIGITLVAGLIAYI